MPTKFVNSNAVGANDGSSWANAWTSLASANGVAAGDIVKVHKTHSQTGLAASITFSNATNTNPVRICCVDKDASDARSTGAVVEWTSASALGPKGSIYSDGITWSANSSGKLDFTGTDNRQVHENATIRHTGSAGAGAITANAGRFVFELINSNINFSGSSSASCSLDCLADGTFLWRGGTYTCRGTQTNLITNSLGAVRAEITGVNFSGTVTNLLEATTVLYLCIRFANCIPPTYTNVLGATPNVEGWEVNLDGFVAGTLTVPAISPTNRAMYAGTVKSSLSRYRTGGSDDGSQANPNSWELASNAKAGAFFSAIHSPPITRWVAAGSQAIKIYVASGVTLNDDEFWIEVLSPSEAGSATAQAAFRSTRCGPTATPAALTTDGSSTWNGSGVGTKQYATVTIAPTIAGPVTVRVHFAKASTTVYVDPRIDI